MGSHTSFRCAILFAIVQSVTPQLARADVYYGFTLIDPDTEQRIENAWVVIDGRRISRVASTRAM